MAVRVFLASGGQRLLNDADGAHCEGPFFLVTRSYVDLDCVATVLTLLCKDVVMADVEKGGAMERVLGTGGPAR